jgi:predicted protein tyrosine phosphatase
VLELPAGQERARRARLPFRARAWRPFSRYPGVECQSAGVHQSANVPLDAELIAWAEIIFVMERLIVLNIPDEYEFLEPSLVRLLEAKVAPFLARYAKP